MKDLDCQKNNKKPIDDGSTVDATVAKKPIGDGLLITTVTAIATRIFFWDKGIRRRTTEGIAYVYVICILCDLF